MRHPGSQAKSAKIAAVQLHCVNVSWRDVRGMRYLFDIETGFSDGKVYSKCLTRDESQSGKS